MDDPTSASAALPLTELRIFVVVVVYRQSPAASVTVQTLARALEAPDAPACTVLLYDNTPAAERTAAAPPSGFHYLAAERNLGLLGAYEAALARAEAEGCDWLLTLDQDTALPPDFFAALAPGLESAQRDERIGVIVPHLAEGAHRLSPAYVGIGRQKPLPAGFAGTPAREARAFNSAALLRVKAVRSIGGFDPCFWLDHFDSWLHHQLYVRGWRMHVLGNLTLQHHFSLLDYGSRVSLERYRNFLGAEAGYIDLYESGFASAVYTAQLAIRWVNQIRRGEARAIRTATRRALWRRCISGKRARIAQWRTAMGPPSPAAPGVSSR